MTKKIAVNILIKNIAKNLEAHFKIEKRKVTSHVADLLQGIVDYSTVANNLGKEYKNGNKSRDAKTGRYISA